MSEADKKKLNDVMGVTPPSDNEIGLNILDELSKCDVSGTGLMDLARATGLNKSNLYTAVYHDYHKKQFGRKRRLTTRMLWLIAKSLGISTQTLLRKRRGRKKINSATNVYKPH